jgi:hypothetical protein
MGDDTTSRRARTPEARARSVSTTVQTGARKVEPIDPRVRIPKKSRIIGGTHRATGAFPSRVATSTDGQQTVATGRRVTGTIPTIRVAR